jgi:hypothetical protein
VLCMVLLTFPTRWNVRIHGTKRHAERLRAVSTKFAYWLNLQLYVASCSLGYRVRGDAISAVGATETCLHCTIVRRALVAMRNRWHASHAEGVVALRRYHHQHHPRQVHHQILLPRVVIESRIQHEPNISHGLPKPDFDRGRRVRQYHSCEPGSAHHAGLILGFPAMGFLERIFVSNKCRAW